MSTTSELLMTFLLNACWQITLVAAAVTLSAWLLRGAATRYQHLLWVFALVLSLCLPALTSFGSPIPSFAARPGARAADTATVVPEAGPANVASLAKVPDSSIPLNRYLVAGLLVVYFLFLLRRSLKLIMAWLSTRALTRYARPIARAGNVAEIAESCRKVIRVTRVRILSSTAVAAPITLGAFNPLIILPEKLLSEVEPNVLASAIGHELVHVVRRDYVFNLIYELIFLPLSFHPAAALMRRRINQTRELRCDELVAEKLLNAEVYARSLVQLAGSALPFGRHATTITVGIADADILEVRIMSLLESTKQKVHQNRLVLVAAALLLALPCVAAASFNLRFNIASSNPAAQEPAQEKKEARAVEAREREEREMKERAEKDPRVRAELEERRNFEREMKAKTQAELVRLARITMDQAIQIATSQQPGKVLESSLVGEHWEAPGKLAKDGLVLYHVVIFTGDETKPAVAHVLVNAIDGTIYKTETEKRREKSLSEQP